MKRCALLTCKTLENYSFTDRILLEPFAQYGWNAEFIPWDQTEVSWSNFQAVIVRATWDYTYRLKEFLSTLRLIDKQGIPLLNPLATIEWNSSKTYLQDLHQLGIPTIPTLTRNLQELDFTTVWEELGVNELVIKPLVSANSNRTFRIQRQDSASVLPALIEAFCTPDGSFQEKFMIQPFLPSVCQEGETSLFYFAGQYSHAVQKIPKKGDFRVQEEHGAAVQSVSPTHELLDVAEMTIERLPVQHLYARLDFVLGNQSKWQLMEAELIEPSLYLNKSPESAVKFVQSFDSFLK